MIMIGIALLGKSEVVSPQQCITFDFYNNSEAEVKLKSCCFVSILFLGYTFYYLLTDRKLLNDVSVGFRLR
jgi:hypothetical protein